MIPLDEQFNSGQGQLRSNHRGKVLDNKDPEMKGRLKISVPGILTAPKEDLPWAIPKYPSSLGGSSNFSDVFIPEEGTEVTVEFPHGDNHMPVYTAKWAQEVVPQEFKENYPERYGRKDSNGTYWYFDKKESRYVFHHVSGFHAEIDKSGQLSIRGPKGIDIKLSTELKAVAPDKVWFNTEVVESTGHVKDSVRTMAADRAIYNSHTHPGFHGPTRVPNQSK